jgi:hypothetical protein
MEEIHGLDLYKKWEETGETGIKSRCCDADVIVEWVENAAYAICSSCGDRIRIVAKKRDEYGCF